MAGGNRAYTIVDVLAQLNNDAAGADTTTIVEINLFGVAQENLKLTDAATATAGALTFSWDNAQNWGVLPWQ